MARSLANASLLGEDACLNPQLIRKRPHCCMTRPTIDVTSITADLEVQWASMEFAWGPKLKMHFTAMNGCRIDGLRESPQLTELAYFGTRTGEA